MLDDIYIKRFLSKNFTVTETNCIEWPGAKDANGYGLMRVKFKGKRTNIGTHRIAYMIKHNCSLNKDELMCHHCDNPKCCNWNHLFLGTHKDNSDDMVSKGRDNRQWPIMFSHNDYLLALNLRSQGLYYSEIATAMGHSTSGIWYLLNKQGNFRE